jgi:guanylate kinase
MSRPGPNALVICGPSGVGKGTLIERLKQEYPHAVGFSVSHTTRGARPGEEDGVHYHFVTVGQMEADIEAGKFLEYANVHGNFYGTSIAAVESVKKTGKICILDIDVQGARQCRQAQLPGTYVFVSPPSFEELEQRLRGRGTEAEDKIRKRLANARGEMDARSEAGLFDQQVRMRLFQARKDIMAMRMACVTEAHAPCPLGACARSDVCNAKYSNAASACDPRMPRLAQIVNDNQDAAYAELKAILGADLQAARRPAGGEPLLQPPSPIREFESDTRPVASALPSVGSWMPASPPRITAQQNLKATADDTTPAMLPAWSFSRLPSVVTWFPRCVLLCGKSEGADGKLQQDKSPQKTARGSSPFIPFESARDKDMDASVMQVSEDDLLPKARNDDLFRSAASDFVDSVLSDASRSRSGDEEDEELSHGFMLFGTESAVSEFVDSVLSDASQSLTGDEENEEEPWSKNVVHHARQILPKPVPKLRVQSQHLPTSTEFEQEEAQYPKKHFGSSNMTLLKWEAHMEDSRLHAESKVLSPISPLQPSPHSRASRPSRRSRPSTTFIEVELEEVLAARKVRSTYKAPSRPPTNYIVEEVREILAARYSFGGRAPGSYNLPQPNVHAKKTAKRRVQNTSRYFHQPDDRDKLDRDAKVLRQELKQLDSKMLLREQSLRARRQKKAGNELLAAHSPGSTSSMLESVERAQMLPQIRNSGQRTQGSSVHSPGSKFIAANLDRIEGAYVLEEEVTPPDKQNSAERSRRLVQTTTLSVFTKYWHKSRNEDLMDLLLRDEKQMVEKHIRMADRKLSRKKSELQRQKLQTANADQEKALKLMRNQDKAEIFNEAARVSMAAMREDLEQAKEDEQDARKHFLSYHEVAKWQDSLTPDQETELAARRHRLTGAEETRERLTREYDKNFQQACLDEAKRFVVMQRRLTLQKTLSQLERQSMDATELEYLHVQDKEDPQSETLMLCNNLFAAVSQYARESGLDYICTMFCMHNLVKGIRSEDLVACINVIGQAEYAGQWVEGKAHGIGVQKLHAHLGKGSRYEGQFSDDRRHGLGALTMRECGVVYEGMWWRGKRHGFGIESHIVKGCSDLLPVAFVQYEEGFRKMTTRFDAQSDIHFYLLDSVRKICASARELACQARNNELFEHVIPAQKKHRSRREAPTMTSTNTSMESAASEFVDSVVDSILSDASRSLSGDEEDEDEKEDWYEDEDEAAQAKAKTEMRQQKMLDKRKRHEAKLAQNQERDVSVPYQRSELEKIDSQVGHAIKDLKSWTDKALGDLHSFMRSAGLTTGKLYAMTKEEMLSLRPPKDPTAEELRHYLSKQGVPKVLVERITKMYVIEQESGKTQQATQNYEEKRRAVLMDLSSDSEWHASEKGSIVIRKRYTGVKMRSMIDEDAVAERQAKTSEWEHMPAIPGIQAVLKLTQPVRGAPLPPSAAISRANSNPGPRNKSGQTPSKPASKGAANTLVRDPSGSDMPSCIFVPMDMPFEQAVSAFNANNHKEIRLLPGTYKIKDMLEIDKSVNIVGEDGARIVGRWRFRGDSYVSSIKNVHLEYNASRSATNFERLLHIDQGELLLQDCAVLCPHGYCLWAGGRSVVNVLGCILAGSADGCYPSQSAAAVMNFRFQQADSDLLLAQPHFCFVVFTPPSTVTSSVSDL